MNMICFISFSSISGLLDVNLVDEFGQITPMWFFVGMMNGSNHSVNFLLYIISGQQFRQKFLMMIQCCHKRRDESSLREESSHRANLAVTQESGLSASTSAVAISNIG